MRVVQLLHSLIKKSCVNIHAKRLTVLFKVVGSLALGKKLSLAGLGRSLKSSTTERHNIKRVDRLLCQV